MKAYGNIFLELTSRRLQLAGIIHSLLECKMRLGSGGRLGKLRLANSTVQIWSLWEPINIITKDNAHAIAIPEDDGDRLIYAFSSYSLPCFDAASCD
jgi:hypothetical protein